MKNSFATGFSEIVGCYGSDVQALESEVLSSILSNGWVFFFFSPHTF